MSRSPACSLQLHLRLRDAIEAVRQNQPVEAVVECVVRHPVPHQAIKKLRRLHQPHMQRTEAFDGGFREDGSPDHAPPLHRQRRDLPASSEARYHHVAVIAKSFCSRVRTEVSPYRGFVEELLSRSVAVPYRKVRRVTWLRICTSCNLAILPPLRGVGPYLHPLPCAVA